MNYSRQECILHEYSDIAATKFVVSPWVNIQWLNGRQSLRMQDSNFHLANQDCEPSLTRLLDEFRDPNTLRSVLASLDMSNRTSAKEHLSNLVQNRVLVPTVLDRGVLRPRLKRNIRRIEIDITWKCDAFCRDCDRSCTQAPTDEMMTLDQIEHFLTESVERSVRYEKIYISGGEPTLHPDILTILSAFSNYKTKFSPQTEIQLYTNGVSPNVTEVLSRRPPGIQVENSMKNSRIQPFFHPFNLAKGDRPEMRDKNWETGCAHSSRWAMGLCKNGFYQCPIAGAIDRVVGFDIGRKTFPDDHDDMLDLFKPICPYCGILFPEFEAGNKTEGGKFPIDTSRVLADLAPNDRPGTISSMWSRAYAQYTRNKPELSKY